jgi:hypothetical protein
MGAPERPASLLKMQKPQTQREKILEQLRQEIKYLLHVYGDEIEKGA